MVVVVEFDGVVVRPQRGGKPLELVPGVEDGLAALKAAGHTLLLYSARANRAARHDPFLDPLVRVGAVKPDRKNQERDEALAEQRYHEMIRFIEAELPDFFDAIDDGQQGRPWAQLYIESPRTIVLDTVGGDGEHSMGWDDIAEVYGDPSRVDEMFPEEET